MTERIVGWKDHSDDRPPIVGSKLPVKKVDVPLHTFLAWWNNLPVPDGVTRASPALFIYDHRDILKSFGRMGMRVYYSSGKAIDVHGREIYVKSSDIGEDHWRGFELAGLLCPFSYYVKNPTIVTRVRPHHTVQNCVFY